MNFDILTLVEYFIGAFVCCIGSYFMGAIVLKRFAPIKKIKNILLLIVFAFFTIINSLIFDNIVKSFGVTLIIFCILFFIHKEKVSKSFALAVIIYIMILLGDTTFALLTSLLNVIFKFDIGVEIFKVFLVNLFVFSMANGYTYLFRKIINKFVKYVDKNNIVYMFPIGILLIFMLMATLYNMLFDNLILNYNMVLYLLIALGCIILSLTLAFQYIKGKELVNKYNLLGDYLKSSAELIEKYSSTTHKYKNNLIAIKGYMKNDINQADEYIDNLLDNYKTKKYAWISKINYIKMDTVRYLIYYKLSKVEEKNLKLTITVSTDIQKIEDKLFTIGEMSTILDIIGEYFDNAIYASNESNEKELNFDLYIENNELVFVIANTYKENINLSLITKNGYTTKGKNHGFGLYDIEKLVKTNSNIKTNYELIEKYFIAKLLVKINKK